MTREEIKQAVLTVFEKCKEECVDGVYYRGNRFMVDGSEYSFSLDKSRPEVNLWGNRGITTLYCAKYDWVTTGTIDGIIETLVDRIEDFEGGFIRCCGCGTKIKNNEVAGRIFAGCYCKHCWESEYKAVEKNITYD